ncbi:hypothetical protein GF373_12405 [bacterium]|nr:hypothetical protein [bacterium]
MKDTHLTPAEYKEFLKTGKLPTQEKPKKKNKFGNHETVYKGRRYRSKKEAKFAHSLDLLVMAGEVIFWVYEVPLPLPGNRKHLVDFFVFYMDGSYRFIDTKGHDHDMGRLKRDQVKDIYGIEIELR